MPQWQISSIKHTIYSKGHNKYTERSLSDRTLVKLIWAVKAIINPGNKKKTYKIPTMKVIVNFHSNANHALKKGERKDKERQEAGKQTNK